MNFAELSFGSCEKRIFDVSYAKFCGNSILNWNTGIAAWDIFTRVLTQLVVGLPVLCACSRAIQGIPTVALMKLNRVSFSSLHLEYGSVFQVLRCPHQYMLLEHGCYGFAPRIQTSCLFREPQLCRFTLFP